MQKNEMPSGALVLLILEAELSDYDRQTKAIQAVLRTA